MLCFWQKATMDALLSSSILFTLSCPFACLCTFRMESTFRPHSIRWSAFLEASARGGFGETALHTRRVKGQFDSVFAPPVGRA